MRKIMGDIVPFPTQNAQQVQGGQLAQAIEAQISSSEIMQVAEKTNKSILQRILPEHYFMSPWEIIIYLEWLREQEISANENKPLLEQVSEQKQAA